MSASQSHAGYGVISFGFLRNHFFLKSALGVTVYVKSSVSQHFIFRPYVDEMLVVTVTGSPHEGCLIAWVLCCQCEELVQETCGKSVLFKTILGTSFISL